MKCHLQQRVDDQDRYFYLSGALSFALFAAVTLLFALMLVAGEKAKTYGLKKDNYISVSINLPTKQRSQADTKKPSPRPVNKQESKPAASSQTTTDVSSLFSDVWTQKVGSKPTKKTTQVDVKRLSAIEKRIKTAQTKPGELASEKLKSLDLTRPSVELVGRSSSSASEVNEYLAKIQAFVYEHFYPPLSSEGNSAKVRIWLESDGRMSGYKILADSGNDVFDREVDVLKKRLESLAFPRHPRAESIVLDIILTAEE